MKVGYLGTFSCYEPGITATRQLVMGVRSYIAAANRRGDTVSSPIECVIGDDRGDRGRGLVEAQRLVEDEGVVALVFVAASIVMEAVLDYAQAAQVPIAGTGGAILPLFRPTNPWLFTARTPYESHAVAMTEELTSRGFTRIAVISTLDGTGRSYAAGVRGQLARSGLAPSAEVLFARLDSDLGAVIRQVAQSAPDAVICTHFSPTSAALVQEAMRVGLHVQWAFGPSATNPETAALVGRSAIEGALGQSSFRLPAEDTPEMAAFRADVDHYAPGAEVTSLTQLGYVSARAVVDAAGRSDRTGTGIRQALENLSGDYGLLPAFQLSADDHLLNRGVQLVRFTEGAMAPLGAMREVDPDTWMISRPAPQPAVGAAAASAPASRESNSGQVKES
jgi:branched-chain amino acid transport system substrate-binding protein